jgi:hypothetical protein
MPYDEKKKMAKELADTILTILKTGLLNTKYNKVGRAFILPSTIFRDVYISGFIHHFLKLNLNNKYNKDRSWTNEEVGGFAFDVFENLNCADEDIELYTKVIKEEKTRKEWDADGRYTLGKTHAGLCHICKYPILADEEKSEILSKARKIIKIKRRIIDNEEYIAKLTTTTYELTIYDYLQKQFGGVLIGKHDFVDENKVEKSQNIKTNVDVDAEKISKIESAKDIYDLPFEYGEKYRKIMKEFELENAPKHIALLYGILFGVGSMMLISFTLTLNRIDNEFQAVIGGLLVGGIAYFAQYQNEKNYSIKYTEKMIKVEEELVNKAKFEHRHKQKG